MAKPFVLLCLLPTIKTFFQTYDDTTISLGGDVHVADTAGTHMLLGIINASTQVDVYHYDLFTKIATAYNRSYDITVSELKTYESNTATSAVYIVLESTTKFIQN